MGPDSIKVTAAGYSGEKVTPASFLIDAAAKPKEALIDSVTKVNFSGTLKFFYHGFKFNFQSNGLN